ncbi:MAG: FAD-binding protein [Fodinibius sp.]|nr:FAD-binding protein [Fodinibius sp.]
MPPTSTETISKLRTAVKGSVILPSHPDYDHARTVWNAMIDRKPAVIVQCATAEDVSPALTFARANNLTVSILGGGHHIAGNAIAEDGLVIDHLLNTRTVSG